MPYEVDFSETREQKIKNFLLARINENRSGILIDDLWEEIRQELSFKSDNLVTQDIGPALGALSEENLIEGDSWYYKEGERLVFKPIIHPTWVDRAVCMFLGHTLPDNCAFETQMALFVGGVCTRCGRLSQGEFLGNVWTSEKEEDGIIRLEGYDLSKAFEKGLRVCRIP